MKNKTNKYLIFFALILFFIAWWIVLNYYWAENIVNYIWIENTYIVVFLLASFWWFSSLTWYPLIALMATFIGGWAMPLLVGLSSGVGVMFWDSLFYYFWSKWREILKWKSKKYVNKLSAWIKRRHEYFIPIFVFIYSWFSPFPNDIMTVSVSLTWYPYKKVFIPLLLGNIIHMILYSYLIYYWYDIVF